MGKCSAWSHTQPGPPARLSALGSFCRSHFINRCVQCEFISFLKSGAHGRAGCNPVNPVPVAATDPYHFPFDSGAVDRHPFSEHRFGWASKHLRADRFRLDRGRNKNIMAELVGNLLVAQSGGPTAVINASLAGVIQEAGRHECIEEIYGGANGILGILNEELIDINDEKARTIEGLKYTPAAALGTCRYKIDFKKKPEQAAKDMDRLFEVFQAHNIRYFAYIGGNDSQDTSHKIHEEAVKRGYEMRVIGVPKTIDNDLPHTDNCPGYGSVIKYNATTVMEVGLDVGSMATDDGSCCIIEVMGRSAGWIAAGTVLAKRGNPANPPHIILVPEIQYDVDAFWPRSRRRWKPTGTASWSSAKASRTSRARKSARTRTVWTPSATRCWPARLRSSRSMSRASSTPKPAPCCLATPSAPPPIVPA